MTKNTKTVHTKGGKATVMPATVHPTRKPASSAKEAASLSRGDVKPGRTG